MPAVSAKYSIQSIGIVLKKNEKKKNQDHDDHVRPSVTPIFALGPKKDAKIIR